MKKIAGLGFIITMTAAQMVLGLRPPLREEQRQEYASNIVTGYVFAVKSEIVTPANARYEMTDKIYHVSIFVGSTEKGDAFVPGQVLEFSFWKANTRPDGMTGDFGQYQVPKQQTLIRAYLIKDENGQFNLLHPNGFDEIG